MREKGEELVNIQIMILLPSFWNNDGKYEENLKYGCKYIYSHLVLDKFQDQQQSKILKRQKMMKLDVEKD